MATMRDICTKALERLFVVAADETPNASDIASALDMANALLAQLSARDVHTGAGTQTLSDTFPLEEKHRLGFTAYLAVNLAGDFGKEANATLQMQAAEGKQLIAADYFAPEPLRVDSALQYMPSQRRYY